MVMLLVLQETGLGQLHLGCDLAGSLRQILCSMVLLGFHLFVSYVLGYGDGDLVLAERLINQQLSVRFTEKKYVVNIPVSFRNRLECVNLSRKFQFQFF